MAIQQQYFDQLSAARRYAAARPFVHPAILQRMCALIGRDHFETALDVGCGTGQSTLALTEIATSVIGVDLSTAMLSCAAVHPRIEYRTAPAEALPLDDGSVDLITVGLAWHWFDAERFLAEARRVLCTEGWLVIYNSAFYGTLPDQPSFIAWFRGDYLKKYPTPSRQTRSPAEFDLPALNLELVHHDDFTVSMPMSHAQFVQYLLTQSNVIAAVELGTSSIDAVNADLHHATEPFFANDAVLVPFHIKMHVLHRPAIVS